MPQGCEMFQRMLVPLDGSAQAGRILPYASGLANRSIFRFCCSRLSTCAWHRRSAAEGMSNNNSNRRSIACTVMVWRPPWPLRLVAGGRDLGVAASQKCDLIVLSTSTRQNTGRGH